ncbi:hypothetical protein HD554DRAFT_2034479 [Boletus coccyginus]|nr:hypothetical protein HD554DRAFT_2034479 [Boletus coccyginus]
MRNSKLKAGIQSINDIDIAVVVAYKRHPHAVFILTTHPCISENLDLQDDLITLVQALSTINANFALMLEWRAALNNLSDLDVMVYQAQKEWKPKPEELGYMLQLSDAELSRKQLKTRQSYKTKQLGRCNGIVLMRINLPYRRPRHTAGHWVDPHSVPMQSPPQMRVERCRYIARDSPREQLERGHSCEKKQSKGCDDIVGPSLSRPTCLTEDLGAGLTLTWSPCRPSPPQRLSGEQLERGHSCGLDAPLGTRLTLTQSHADHLPLKETLPGSRWKKDTHVKQSGPGDANCGMVGPSQSRANLPHRRSGCTAGRWVDPHFMVLIQLSPSQTRVE